MPQYAPMDSKAIKFLTIHCAATPEGKPFTAQRIADMDIARFGQESYHWIIELDGTVSHRLQDNQKGAHVAGNNTGNIGVCYVGGVDANGKPKDTRTPAQKAAMAKIVKDYQTKFPSIVVRGHRDWPKVAKACPCFDVGAWLKAGMPG